MKNTIKSIEDIIKTELERLPTTIDEMAAKDRANFVIQLMKYKDTKEDNEDLSVW